MKRVPGSLIIAVVLLAMAWLPVHAAGEKTVIELWDTVKAPPPPEVKPVTVDPATSAFLVLDIEQRTCNTDARPRCVASVPAIAAFLQKARQKGMLVVYSLTSAGTPETILPKVAPLGSETVVKSSVDKFYNTELEKVLKDFGVKTLIIAGTAAEGAVLHTATGAAMRGFAVIVPVDGMSSATPYAEQYTAWHLLNAPGTRQKATLTRFDLIGF